MEEYQFPTKKHSRYKKLFNYAIVFFVVFITLGTFLFSYFSSVPPILEEKIVTIEEGTSLIGVSKLLKNEGIIRSSSVFRLVGQLQDISVKAGTYSFSEERRITEILQRLHTSDYGDVYIPVTFPEGITLEEMSDILEATDLENFNSAEFKTLTQSKEGYLFPDTYSFLPDVDTQAIVEIMSTNFTQRTEDLKESITGIRSWKDIIIMASLIEKEASSNSEEQEMVAGILWKRLDRGIPLQVDAPFVYAIGKGSSALRTSDLRSDGPYNTYTRKGLTPTPIGNPGLSAIRAAINPKESLYFFYLHDTNGGIHYGVTHNDHVRNKQRYL